MELRGGNLASAAPLLAVDKVRLSFGGTEALVDVSLRLAEGEKMTIVGPSGSGKTSLLRVIAGLEAPGAGAVRLGGRDMNGPGFTVPPQKRAVGMIFQNLALWPHLTVAGNIGLGLRAKGMDRAGTRGVVRSILDEFGMAHLVERYPHTLSAGEQQRAALARALVLKPRLLLLDEPFSHLDHDLRDSLLELIKGLKTSLIFVTHNQEDAFSMGGTLGVMHQGRLEQTGSMQEILESPGTEFVRRFVRSPVRG